MRLIGDYSFLGTVVYLLRLGLNHAPPGTVTEESRRKIVEWCDSFESEKNDNDRLDVRLNRE